MKFPLFAALLLYNTLAAAQTDSSLAATLATMVIADQQAAGLPPKGQTFASPEWLRFKDSVFTSHYHRLQEIFVRSGYPGYDKVGIKGSHHFWLLVQHMDKWPGFQEEVLEALQKEVIRSNAAAEDLAYLTDRVRLNKGRLQVYGTQVSYNLDSCQAFPRSLEDPASVNMRRKAVGMGPLEQYLNGMSESHFLMNRKMYEGKGIKGPKLYAVPVL